MSSRRQSLFLAPLRSSLLRTATTLVVAAAVASTLAGCDTQPTPTLTSTATRVAKAAPTATNTPIPFPTPTRQPIPTGPAKSPVQVGPTASTGSADGAVQQTLARMTLEQKIGQMLMIGFSGTTAEGASSIIQRLQPGSIVFLATNLKTPAQVGTLTKDLQAIAVATGAGVPLFLAVDQEGGEVQRLKEEVTYFPSKLTLGATARADLAKLEGEVEGREMSAMGLNMNLSPSLDLDTSPPSPIIGAYERSMSANPALVGELGSAYIQALQGKGVLAVAKHYPGHGRTTDDSHVTLPVLNDSLSTLQGLDLVPFKAAVQARVGGIMAAHILVPSVDDKWPTSLSPAWIDRILRLEMGYGGLIMTDDSAMGALTNSLEPGELAVQAVKAGCDLIMLVGDETKQTQMYQALLQAVRGGSISIDRVNSSVTRILRAKSQIGLLNAPQRTATPFAPDSASLQTVAEAAVTLVRDPGNLVPSAVQKAKKILIVGNDKLPMGSTASSTRLGQVIKDRKPQGTELVFSLSNDNSQLTDRILSEATSAELVVFASYEAGPWQQSMLRKLRAQGSVVVDIGFWRPEEVANIPVDVAYLAAYYPSAPMVDAAVRALFGEIKTTGRLPVAVPGVYQVGHGMTR